MVRHPAPGINEPLVNVNLVLQIRPVRPKKGFEGLSGELLSRVVVRIAIRHGRAEPLVVNGIAYRCGAFDVLLVLRNMRCQYGRRGHA